MGIVSSHIHLRLMRQHNTQYPYMIINPPESSIPEIYNGWEEYDFEIDFFNLYQTAAQNNVTLEKRWDNLTGFSDGMV